MNTSLVDTVEVARPCTASWEEMAGDARSRFCKHCSKNVYDISQLTRSEAEDLIRAKEGQLCVRFFRRRDGRVMTSECSPAVRRTLWLPATVAAFGVMIVLLIFRSFVAPAEPGQRVSLRDVEPFRTIMDWLYPSREMGKMCRPPLPPPALGSDGAPPIHELPDDGPESQE